MINSHSVKIRKAVLPVAGVGTRFLPASKVVPKELFPVVDKPVIQYLVEELVESGIEEILFVISRGKEAILDHFKPDPDLEQLLLDRGKRELFKKVHSIHQLAQFHHVYQPEPKGDGDAILQAKEWVKDEPFVILFGDDLVKHSVPATRQLMECFRGEAIMAVEKVIGEGISAYGVIAPEFSEGRLHKVAHMVEKPSFKEAPSDLGVIGKYICPPDIFEAIEQSGTSAGGERRLIDGFIELAKTQGIWAYQVEGERFDTGNPAGWIAANQAFLKK